MHKMKKKKNLLNFLISLFLESILILSTWFMTPCLVAALVKVVTEAPADLCSETVSVSRANIVSP